jgi:hypothetical protein
MLAPVQCAIAFEIAAPASHMGPEPKTDRRFMPHVASSAISRIEYSARTRELHVVFATGRSYAYFAVPAEVYYQFVRAVSKGEFFNAMIRDRYQFEERHR